jgi:hypothetical protein
MATLWFECRPASSYLKQTHMVFSESPQILNPLLLLVAGEGSSPSSCGFDSSSRHHNMIYNINLLINL